MDLKDHIVLQEIQIELSESELSEKIKHMSSYNSQVKAFNNVGFDLLKKEEEFAKNRCKKTEPEWYGCEVVYEVGK